MRRALIVAAGLLAAGAPSVACAHAIFPGRIVVQTMGDRAVVQLRAVNARRDVSTFAVEVYPADSWIPARNAVAWPAKFNVLATDPDSPTVSHDQAFSVLVDLQGKQEQLLHVCTKSVPSWDQLQGKKAIVNTRVCANVVVQRYRP